MTNNNPGRVHRAALALSLWLANATAVQGAPPPAVEGFINAPVAQVWRMFTTPEGLQQSGATQADVDLRLGGEIRTHYDAGGRLGDEATVVDEVLAFEPEHMLATRRKAGAPAAGQSASAWKVIYMTPSGEQMTHVRIVGLGHEDGERSQASRESFINDHRALLDRIARPYWPKCALCKAE